MNPTADDLRDAEQFLEESIRRSWGPPEKYQPRSNNASKAGHPCPLYLWAVRARWEEMPTVDQSVMGIFRMGHDIARGLREDLLEAGWELTRDEVTYEDKDLDIRGRVDWYLRKRGHPVFDRAVPTEVKSASPYVYKTIDTFGALTESTYAHVRLWPVQTLLYPYLAPDERPVACLLVRDKSTRACKAMMVKVDEWWHLLERMNEVLAVVNRCLADGTEPEPIPYDPVWCERCDAAAICPRMMNRVTGGATLLLEPADAESLDAMIREWSSLSEAASRHTKVYAAIKDRLAHFGRYDGEPGDVRTAITNEYRCTVKFHANQARLSIVPMVADLEE